MMDDLIEILRAKSSDQENYLLKDHLKEAVIRVVQLYIFMDENQDSFDYDLVSNDEIFQKLVVAAILHDLGKIDYTFQRKVFSRDERENGTDWKDLKWFFRQLNNPTIRYPRHEILSAVWSAFLIGNTESDKKIRTAILLHHYNEYFIGEKDFMEIIFNYKRSVISYLEFIKRNYNVFQSFFETLITYIEEECRDSNIATAAIQLLRVDLNADITIENINLLLKKINSQDDDISEFAEFYKVENENLDYDFLVLLGFLRRCDYSSSGGVPIEQGKLKAVFEGLSENIEENINKKGTKIHLWQTDVLKTIDTNKSLILVAPTGSGKTEFALLWAEKNKRKLIYTLPLRVALNDLFSRFSNSNNGYFKSESVDLLHSTAFIEYMKEEKTGQELDMDKMMTSARMLSSPIVLTTPDQVFLTSLNYYGSDKLISIYPFSSVVVDEIQTYNEEMAAIIIKTLGIIHKVHGKLLVITATFPPYFKKFFEEIGGSDFKVLDVAELDDKTKSRIKNFGLRRHKLKVLESNLFDEDANIHGENELESWIDSFENKNLFIVVNNVKKAIKIYKKFEKENVYLLHSRLLEIEKSRRIQEIKERKEKNEKIIVVATQIIEASVDLDFDAMITEISTIDSQIQRWGRVHRNRGADYCENIPNIVIFAGSPLEDGSLKLDRGTSFVYDRKVVEKTFEVLKDNENTQNSLNYEDERKMISNVFEREKDGKKLKEIYEEEIEKTLDYLNYFTVEKKSQAQRLFRKIAGFKVVIPKLIELEKDEKSIENIFMKSIKENPTSWKEIRANIKTITGVEVDTWELKKILYEYSINVPIYYEDKSDFWHRDTTEFKGFYFWNKVTDAEIESVMKYGLDSILSENSSVFM
jgi:CRISPR-associated endonuclease/helicase Cas3